MGIFFLGGKKKSNNSQGPAMKPHEYTGVQTRQDDEEKPEERSGMSSGTCALEGNEMKSTLPALRFLKKESP